VAEHRRELGQPIDVRLNPLVVLVGGPAKDARFGHDRTLTDGGAVRSVPLGPNRAGASTEPNRDP
jgi:hypothetical protein